MNVTKPATPFWGAIVLGVWLTVPSTCMDSKRSSQTVPCLAAAGLEELVDCIQTYMPKSDTEGYRPPSNGVRRTWRRVVQRMLKDAEDCDASFGLNRDLRAGYRLSPFTDRSTKQTYCVLMETADEVPHFPQVDRGWGTLIVNPQPRTPLHIQVPHPHHEPGTANQGIELFQALQAQSFLMAGANRHANARPSTCQPRHREADSGHDAGTLFQVAAEVLWNLDRDTTPPPVVLQFHGKTFFDCRALDVYMTYGNRTPPQPGDLLRTLRDRLAEQHPQWRIGVPGGTPACGLHGSTNIQGRLWNGVAPQQVCGTPASRVSKRFIYIVQAPGPSRYADHWTEALRATFSP